MVRQKRDRFGIDEKRRRIETRPSPPTDRLEGPESTHVANGEVENHSGDVHGSGDWGDNGSTPGAITVKEEAAESPVPSGSELLTEEVEEGLWTEDRENSLIELYKNCTFLYDKTLPSYKLKHKKHAAFSKFGVILGIPADEVARRIKCIRTMYGRIRAEAANRSDHDAAKPMTSRRQYILQMMDFLNPYYQARAKSMSLSIKPPDYSMYLDEEDRIEGEENEEGGAVDFQEDDEFDDAAGAGDAWGNDEVVNNGEVSTDTDTTKGYNARHASVSASNKRHVEEPLSKGQYNKLTNVLDNFSNVLQTFANRPTSTVSQKRQKVDRWLSCLGDKMEEMPEDTLVYFEKHVDDIAFEVRRGDWDISSTVQTTKPPRLDVVVYPSFHVNQGASS